MAKHPVPKKKASQARSARRYASFAGKKRKNINNFVSVVTCSACGKPTLNQQACRSCGNYRGRRNVIDKVKLTEKITKIKA